MATTNKTNTDGTKHKWTKLPSTIERDWSMLPADVAYMIAILILQDDVVDFYSFRATCHNWRSGTDNFTQDLSAPYLRPRKWIMLMDVDGSPNKQKYFLNISNGRMLRMRVPELNSQHKVLTTADGLLIIGDNTKTKLLNPLTRFCIEFPPLFLNPFIKLRVTGAAVTSDSTVILCIASFNRNGTIQYAGKKNRIWKVFADNIFLSDNACFRNTLLYRDQLYTVNDNGTIKLLDIMSHPVVRIKITPTFGSNSLSFFLVESKGQMLLVRKVLIDEYHEKVSFEFFEVDIPHRTLIPISSIGDQALFISDERTLSISAGCLPIVKADSIYFARHVNLVKRYCMGCVYYLPNGSTKNLHLFSVLNELYYNWSLSKNATRKEQALSIQPYSLIDHILCYCYQQAWSSGYMYYEHWE